MTATPVYSVEDIFHTSWRQLVPRTHAQVAVLWAAYQAELKKHSAASADSESGRALGLIRIQLLRALRHNWRLADQIDVAQALDIFNSLTFLQEPWYFFPPLGPRMRLSGFRPPDEQMARSSFDIFIYADNEFTSYVATGKATHLHRLIATLYPVTTDKFFDKELVSERAGFVANHVAPWKQQLILLTYMHVRGFVVGRCKTLLPKPVQTDDEPPAPVTPSGPMWYKLKHEVAKTLVFGPFEEVGRANMYSVLDHLELQAQQNERRKPHG